MKPIQIIGCGPGVCELLTVGGLQVALICDCLLGPVHLLKLFKEYTGPRITSFDNSIDIIAQIEALRIRHRSIGVLVNGDTGLCSYAGPVLAYFGKVECELHPGVSTMQLACARMGVSWGQARIVCERDDYCKALPKDWASSESLIIVLGETVASVVLCTQIAQMLGSEWSATACSNLGLRAESVKPVHSWDDVEFVERTVFVFQKKLKDDAARV